MSTSLVIGILCLPSTAQSPPKGQDIPSLLDDADNYFAQSDLNRAFNLYQELLKNGYSSTHLLNNLGYIYHYGKKEYARARAMYQKSLEIDYKNSWTHFSLSQLYFDIGRLEDGIEEYELYMKYDDMKRLPIDAEKILEILKGRNLPAEEKSNLLRRVGDINPNDYATIKALADYDRDNKEFGRALVKYQRVMELAPHMKMVYFDIGSCYANLNEPELALEYFAKSEEAGYDVPDDFFVSLNERIQGKGNKMNSGIPKVLGHVPNSGLKKDERRRPEK